MSKSKKIFSIIAILIVAIAGIACIGIGFSIFNSPKNILVTTIDTIAKGLTSGTKKETEESAMQFLYNTDKIEMNTKAKLTIDEEFGLGIKNAEINMNYVENKSNLKSSIDASLLIDNEKQLDISTILADSKVYLKFKEAFSKYYYQEQEYISLFEQVKIDNYDIFRKIFIEALKSSLKDNDFVSSKEEITYGTESNVKVTKNSLEITNDKFATILNEFFTRIKENEDATRILTEQLNVTKEELSDSFTKIIEELKNSKSTETIDLNVYVKGFNSVVLTELDLDTTLIQYYTYDNTKQIVLKTPSIDTIDNNYYSYGDYTISETANNNDEAKYDSIVVTVVTDKDISNVTLNINDKQYLTGTVTKVDDGYNFDFSIPYNELTLNVKGKVTSKEVSPNAEYNSVIDVNISMENEGKTYNLGLNMEVTFKIGSEIDTSIIKDSLPMEEMTSEDSNALLSIPIMQSLLSPDITTY